ncbi:MAG: hypothetical protein NDI77_14325 [Geobacteraceae bacterium]|nr:hypothetical protein [Geobacteraceae bacterium]
MAFLPPNILNCGINSMLDYTTISPERLFRRWHDMGRNVVLIVHGAAQFIGKFALRESGMRLEHLKNSGIAGFGNFGTTNAE